MKIDREKLFDIYVGLYDELLVLLERMHLQEGRMTVSDFIETDNAIQAHIKAMNRVNEKAAEMKFKLFIPISVKHNLHYC